ncbi:MAG TPA: cupredoxin domain-containing protein [Candidatus Limnocylindrales bacterium]|nr:cupredoxin domain-containing protein [Candidatus Limnocylindrales bacterium]
MRVRRKILEPLVIAGALSLLLAGAGCQAKKEPKAVVSTPVVVKGDIPVLITEKGFEPSRIEVPKGANATLVFTRMTDNTCATEIVIAGTGARLKLPLNKPIRIALGTVNTNIPFACAMGMLHGEVVAKPL